MRYLEVKPAYNDMSDSSTLFVRFMDGVSSIHVESKFYNYHTQADQYAYDSLQWVKYGNLPDC
jgi:hypothetical protein